jgi:hypothetical protein
MTVRFGASRIGPCRGTRLSLAVAAPDIVVVRIGAAVPGSGCRHGAATRACGQLIALTRGNTRSRA